MNKRILRMILIFGFCGAVLALLLQESVAESTSVATETSLILNDFYDLQGNMEKNAPNTFFCWGFLSALLFFSSRGYGLIKKEASIQLISKSYIAQIQARAPPTTFLP